MVYYLLTIYEKKYGYYKRLGNRIKIEKNNIKIILTRQIAKI